MSEQRLVTFHGGPMDGMLRAFEAGQTTFPVMRWHWMFDTPLPPFEYTSGLYRADLDGGDAWWEWVGDDPPRPPSPSILRRMAWWRSRAEAAGLTPGVKG